MSKINRLPKELAELIAAGEVIERPASIVKELLENAIDAKATRIIVEIKNGGICYIRVTDNGCGMSREDVPTAFIRHATSKVSTKDDLDNILTMGFRGEALPSISAVSRVELTSREANDIIGTRFTLQGTDNGEIEEVGCPVGTTIVVRDLFYNIPARIKFLKKDVVEGNTVASIVERIALANPSIGITFIRENATRFSTPGDGRLITVVRLVMGSEFSSSMIPAKWEDDNIKVWGYITKPSASRSNRTSQHFIINGRYVRSKTCTAALEETYRMRLMGGRFPGCVLNIELKPSQIDVNVHPAKLEVRFSDERMVYNGVYAACKESLDVLENVPAVKQFNPFTLTADDNTQLTMTTKAEEIINPSNNIGDRLSDVKCNLNGSDISSHKEYYVERSVPPIIKKEDDINSQNSITEGYMRMMQTFSKPILEEDYVKSNTFTDYTREVENALKTSEQTICPTVNDNKSVLDTDDAEQSFLDDGIEESSDFECQTDNNYKVELIAEDKNVIEYKVLGEIFDCFIVCEAASELILVDKHATHERHLYNRIKQDIDSNSRQLVLTNNVALLRGDDYRTITENPEVLSNLGIVFRDIGDGAIIIEEMALVLVDFPIQSILEDIAEHIRRNTVEITPYLLDELLFSVACRCAVMAGKKSSYADLLQLAEMAINGEARHCPHGRPTTISMTENEIQRMFGRTS